MTDNTSIWQRSIRRLVARAALAFVVLGLSTALVAEPADAQADRLRRRAKRELEKKAKDAVEGAVKCAVGDKACVDKAKKDGNPVVMTDDDGTVITDGNGNPVSDPDQAEALSQAPGEGVWRNYDFVPGDTVWKATDFADEPVGRFPARQIEFVRGNMQIVEYDGEKAIEVSNRSVFRLKLPGTLPQQFTLEADIQIPAANFFTTIYFSTLDKSQSQYEWDYVHYYARPGIYRKGQAVSNVYLPSVQDTWMPLKLQVDSAYAIVYVGTERVAQVPTANFARSDVVEFHMRGNPRLRSYIKNIVVSVGLNSLYEALTTTGSFVTRGIQFDLDSDKLRPESTPVLTQIASTLQEHPDLKIAVEGHTDAQGREEYNQQLSERRAASVVRYLTDQGIEAGRLSAVGKGEAEPMADNETPEGRQQNRRVVIRRVD